MANYKNQHYVPAFHMRNFSESFPYLGKTVQVYLKESKRFICNAAIKDQSSENYFYANGDIAEKIENILSDIENIAWGIFDQIIKSDHYNFEDEEIDYKLKLYVFVLYNRTKKTFNSVDEMITSNFIKILESETRKINIADNQKILNVLNDDTTTITYPKAHLDGIGYAIKHMNLVKDLKVIILKNESDKEFIFSDNPVIFYNSFYEEKSQYISGIGVAVVGFQIILPVNPKHAILIYDDSTYHLIGNTSIKNIYDSAVIDRINTCQYLSSNKVLYSTGSLTNSDIENFNEIIENFKKKQHIPVDHANSLNFGLDCYRVGLKFSFLNIRSTRNKKKLPIYSGALTREAISSALTEIGEKPFKYSKSLEKLHKDKLFKH